MAVCRATRSPNQCFAINTKYKDATASETIEGSRTANSVLPRREVNSRMVHAIMGVWSW